MSFKRPGRAMAAPTLRPLLVAVALACGTGLASAQSLGAVVDLARGFDSSYLAARASADAAQYSYEVAQAPLRPQVSATVQVQRVDSNNPDSTPSTVSNRTTSGQVVLQQSLFNRSSELAAEEAHRQLDITRAALDAAEQDLIVRVASAYFDVLTSTNALQTVMANKAAIAEQLASAKRNFEVGNATITDTREAQARFDLAVAQELAARNDLQVKQVTLDQLVGRAGIAVQGLPSPVTLPAVMPSESSDWVRLAETQNPGLRRAQLGWDIAQLETRKAKSGHLPTLGFQATVGRAKEFSNIPSVAVGGSGTTGTMAVVLNVPLFSGLAVQNTVKQDVALEEKARVTFEGAKQSATLGVRTAFLGTQSGLAQVKALEAAEASSRVALEATQLGYKVGVKVNLDVLNAQSQLFQTQRDLSKARYDYLLATLKLRQAAGSLTGNDLIPLTAMMTAAPAKP